MWGSAPGGSGGGAGATLAGGGPTAPGCCAPFTTCSARYSSRWEISLEPCRERRERREEGTRRHATRLEGWWRCPGSVANLALPTCTLPPQWPCIVPANPKKSAFLSLPTCTPALSPRRPIHRATQLGADQPTPTPTPSPTHRGVELKQLRVALDEGCGGGAAQELGVAQHVLQEGDVGLQRGAMGRVAGVGTGLCQVAVAGEPAGSTT